MKYVQIVEDYPYSTCVNTFAFLDNILLKESISWPWTCLACNSSRFSSNSCCIFCFMLLSICRWMSRSWAISSAPCWWICRSWAMFFSICWWTALLSRSFLFSVSSTSIWQTHNISNISLLKTSHIVTCSFKCTVTEMILHNKLMMHYNYKNNTIWHVYVSIFWGWTIYYILNSLQTDHQGRSPTCLR